MATDFHAGQTVLVTGHYDFAGRATHGATGRVVEVHRYPATVVEGGAIVDVEILDGYFTDGAPAYGPRVPFTPANLTVVAEDA